MVIVYYVLGGWLAINGTLFATLMMRRDRPRTRARLFNWIIHHSARRPRRSGRPVGLSR
jgi:hypothetical protein